MFLPIIRPFNVEFIRVYLPKVKRVGKKDLLQFLDFDR